MDLFNFDNSHFVKGYRSIKKAKNARKISEQTGASFSDAYKLEHAYKILGDINSYDSEMREKTDNELRQYTDEFRDRIDNGESLDSVLPEAYAVVRESARRIYGNNGEEVKGSARADRKKCEKIFGEGESPKFGMHYDVQVIGGIMLHKGYVAEMYTGEGKTLSATLPAYLNALTEKGVHIVTANDYLAKRDAKWMSPLFNFLGMNVGVIHEKDELGLDASLYGRLIIPKEERKIAYNCDVTYGKSSEFGFDFLRDNTKGSLDEKVQRELNFAIVDEVDNLLIDEATTPLILSGETKVDNEYRKKLKSADMIAEALIEMQKNLVESKKDEYNEELVYLKIKKSEGKTSRKENKKIEKLEKERQLLEKSLHADIFPGANIEYNVHSEEESPNFFHVDVKEGRAYVDNAGMKWMEENPMVGHLGNYDLDDIELANFVNAALKAHTLFHKDNQYVVEIVDGKPKVTIVDQKTGRKSPTKRWSNGIHEAIEAKEGIETTIRGISEAVISLPFYFAKYSKKAGMTGTAKTDAKEFRETYHMDVVEIPTNKPVKRVDYADILYTTENEKFDAVVDEIAAWHSIGRPVLVGTTSIEKSKNLAEKLKAKGITNYEILNAEKENIEREAEIIAKAGKRKAITIATNMAGRGTDISLGKGVEKIGYGFVYDYEKRKLVEAGEDKSEGGLVVIGTERHDSRRVDNQLRGRAGRQGDPGTTRFYVSLEDPIFMYLPESVKKIISLPFSRGEGYEGYAVKKLVRQAQKNTAELGCGIRKSLLEFDSFLDKQRNAVYNLRNEMLEGKNIRNYIFNVLDCIVKEIAEDAGKEVKEITRRQERLYADEEISQEEDSLIKAGFEQWYKQRHNLEDKKQENFSILDVDDSDKRDFMLERRLSAMFDFNVDVPEDFALESEAVGDKALKEICEQIKEEYQRRAEIIGNGFDDNESHTLLLDTDMNWKEHITNLKWLREGIWTRGYANKDPKEEYIIESTEFFDEFLRNSVRTTMFSMIRMPRLKEKEPAEA